MKGFIICVSVMLVIGYCQIDVNGQDLPAQRSDRVLNGRAVNLPRPEYPAAARIEKIDGPVQVQITVDEGGNVVTAKAFKKLPESETTPERSEALRQLLEAAERAALAATFRPAPVKVSGTIVYEFVLEEDEADADTPSAIKGGVLNGKAKELPPPAYPAAARAVAADGTVLVRVLISEGGEVISAAAVAGHPLLRASAVAAARKARFEPTYLSGEAVKVSGIITYNFVLVRKEN